MKQISCEKCGKYVGRFELSLREELSSMCIDCFKIEIDMESKWFE